MNSTRLIALSVTVLLTGCAQDVPYREHGFAAKFDTPTCKALYAEYDKAPTQGAYPEIKDSANDCWKRSREEHDVYDLLFVEFDDQGWVQGSSKLDLAEKKDFLDQFMAQLEQLYQSQRTAQREGGLSLVVYVHGWHHSAEAGDEDVHAFRRMLRQIAQMEEGLASVGYLPKRVVGIYVGWRGESVPIGIVRKLTFWDRKNAAARVSNGSVRELFARLDHFRDTRRASKERKEVRNVRMLTIGHSFGGLITFESLSSEFVRQSVRFREVLPDGSFDRWMSRVGDLVVIVNPAFEGTRYEPLRAANVRLKDIEPNQLPTVIIATSEGDWATKIAFPAARYLGTRLEIERSPEQRKANVQAIGHNDRFTTHRLSRGTCTEGDCSKACLTAAADPKAKVPGTVADNKLRAEYFLMRRIQKEGVAPVEHLCNEMKLERTKAPVPEHNPFWVVQTTRDVIADHGDIFNPNFVAFLRQMYLGFIFARSGLLPD